MDTFAKKMDTDARLARLVSQVNSGEIQSIAEADTSPVSTSLLFESVKFAPESTGPSRVMPKVQLTESDKTDLKQGLLKLFEDYEDSDEDIDPDAVDVIIKDVVHKNVGLNDAERRLPSAVQNDVLETKRSLAYDLLSTIARELSEDATPSDGELNGDEGSKPDGDKSKDDKSKDDDDKSKDDEPVAADFGVIPLDESSKGKPASTKGGKPVTGKEECDNPAITESSDGEGDSLDADDESLSEAAGSIADAPADVPAAEPTAPTPEVTPAASTDAQVDDIPDVDPADVEIIDEPKADSEGSTVETLVKKVDALADAVKALAGAFKVAGAAALTESTAGEQKKPGFQKKLAPVASVGADGIVDISIDLDELTKGIKDGPKGKKTGGPVSSAQGKKINSSEPPKSVGDKPKDGRPAPTAKAYAATLNEAADLARKILAERA